MKKGKLLDLAEWRYKKILTYGWAYCFLDRHTDALIYSMLHPQEDSRLQISRVFLDAYLELVKQHVIGVHPRLIYNIDEKGFSDWEERKSLRGIVPAPMEGNQIHFPVTRKIKHQTMLVCINTGGETLCPLIVTSDPATKWVFRDSIEEDVDLKVHLGHST
jgi:hypothetical protein